MAGKGELALLEAPGTTGAGEAGGEAGAVPIGTTGGTTGLEAGIGELPEPEDGTTGLLDGIGELPEPEDGTTGTTGIDAGDSDGDTVTVR